MDACVDFRSYRLYEQGAGPRRVVKLITRAEGERMVRSETAQEGLDWDGVTLCFQLIGASAASAVPTFVPRSKLGITGLETPNTAFSQPEVMAIAGTKFKHGRSRTKRMSEQQREARARRIYNDGIVRNGATVYGITVGPEDLVERATNKFKAWAQIPVLQDRMREVASL